MASHGVVPVEEYEYARSFHISHLLSRPSNCTLSYETLPSHFSLADNMLAGAFAGIAVRLWVIILLANSELNHV